MTDHLATLGALGFTYRTRRLADRIVESGRRLYDAVGLPLEPNWHTLLLYLHERGTVSVTEAADALRVSHPAVIEMTRRMEAAGLVVTRPDPDDGRRRALALSAAGRRRMPEFVRVWTVIADQLDELIEQTSGGDALSALATIEALLDEQELDVRVLASMARAEEAAARATTPVDDVRIRRAKESDRSAVLHIARELVRTADTYAYDPDIGDDDLWRYWCPDGPGVGYVAERAGQVIGMFVIRPNHPGPGAHVANASYAVRADVRGLGLGRRMGEASLPIAAELGYRAMQFNAVVSTNDHAVRLWRSLGFRTIGTVPDGFRLPDGTTVAHFVMYRTLP